jgi:hypothetical protein
MSKEMPTSDEEFLRQEQITELQEKHEESDITPDLNSFLRLHKEEYLLKDDPEINGSELGNLINGRNGLYELTMHGDYAELEYVDSFGNIAKAKIEFNKIKEYDAYLSPNDKKFLEMRIISDLHN